MSFRRSHIGVACAALLCAGLVQGEEGVRRPRGPLVYDSQWVLHEFDPGVAATPTPEPNDRAPGSMATYFEDLKERWLTADTPFGEETHTPLFLPPGMTPPPARKEQPSSRNWVLPTLDDETSAAESEGAPRQDSSGWGWLADEVEQRQRMREMQTSVSANAEEEDAAAAARRDPVARFNTEAMLMPGLIRETGSDREPDPRDGRPESVTTPSALNAAYDDRWYGSSPVSESSMSPSPWAADAANTGGAEWSGSSWRDDTSSSGLGAASLAPDFGSWRERVNTSAGGEASPSAGGSFTREAWGADSGRSTAMGLSTPTTETWGGDRVGSFSPAGGGSSVGSGWTADWSSEAGWRGGSFASPTAPAPISSPSVTPRSPSLTTPSATPGISINSSGWLAEPQR